MTYAELDVDPARSPAYHATEDERGVRTVTLRYVEGGGDRAPAASRVASSSDDAAIGWSDPDGVQAVALAILRHFTGAEPDQALLEALVMDLGDDWTSQSEWTLSITELRRIVDHQ